MKRTDKLARADGGKTGKSKVRRGGGALPEELTLDSSPEKILKVLSGASKRFNSDLTHLIGRDENGKLLFVAVYARGEDAEALERWLESTAHPEADEPSSQAPPIIGGAS